MPRVKVEKKRWTYTQHLCLYEKDGVCYYPEYCKYWKKCHDERGTIFSHGWGKKMLTLLELKRPPKPTKPKKDRELDQFLDNDKKA